MLGLMVASASADPVYPSGDQVDQAQRAVQLDKAAIAPIQAQFDAAQRRLDTLVRWSQIAAERYDAATLHLQRAQLSAQGAGDKFAAAQRRYADARSDLGRLAAAAYRDAGGLGSVSLVVGSGGPEQLATGAHILAHRNADLEATLLTADQARQEAGRAQVAAYAAVRRQTIAQAQVAAAEQTARAAVAAQQGQLAAVSAQRDSLLVRLAAAQRTSVELEQQRQKGLAEEAARRAAEAGAKRYATPAYDYSLASAALTYALAQLGKPYVWGATGPDSFDCSGLTMRAWGAAGVTLPHFAAFQYQASHPLSYGDLRPGDLLFWATDGTDSNTIYHEAIYLGGQRMIQAPRSGQNVEISSIWMWGPIQFFARPH